MRIFVETRRFCPDGFILSAKVLNKHLLFKQPANRYCWVRCLSMSLWYPEAQAAQAAKKLGYLFLKTPWWFQFSLAYPHSTMNLHLSTKRKPIESSEILSGTSYFQFQGASFSSSSKGFVKKSPLFTPLFLWKKVSRLLKKASLRSHFSDNFGHWKVSSEKGFLGGPPKHWKLHESDAPSPTKLEKLETPESPPANQ